MRSPLFAIARLLVFLTAPLSVAAQAPWCEQDGAFGLRFGERPPPGSVFIDGGRAAKWFLVKPSKPQAPFDHYMVYADASDETIVVIHAYQTVAPRITRSNQSVNSIKPEARPKALRAYLDLLDAIPPSVRATQVASNSYDNDDWLFRVTDDVQMGLSLESPTPQTQFAFAAVMRCVSNAADRKLTRRVVQEQFK
jgi:hypothetical protein